MGRVRERLVSAIKMEMKCLSVHQINSLIGSVEGLGENQARRRTPLSTQNYISDGIKAGLPVSSNSTISQIRDA